MKGLYIKANWAPKPDYKMSEWEKKTQRSMRGNMAWRDLKVAVEERPMPVLKEDEVLLKVGACGVCGSDIHMIENGEDGYMTYPGHTKFPVILGHEFAGEVMEIGSKVTRFQVGDLVTVEEMQWCGKCDACKIGRFNQCRQLEEPGFTIDGGFAEYVTAKEKFCWNLDELYEMYQGDKLATLEAGALVEPTCVAYHGIFANGGGIQVGGHVAVYGCGPIGLSAIALCKAAGAGKIIAFDTVQSRIDLAREMGADYAFNSLELQTAGGTAWETVMEVTKGVGAATVVEATGALHFIYKDVENSLAIGGKIIQCGMGVHRASIDMAAIQYKSGHLHGTVGTAGADIFPCVIRLMAAGRIDMRKMVTARVPLEQAVEGIHQSANKGGGKVLISQHYKK